MINIKGAGSRGARVLPFYIYIYLFPFFLNFYKFSYFRGKNTNNLQTNNLHQQPTPTTNNLHQHQQPTPTTNNQHQQPTPTTNNLHKQQTQTTNTNNQHQPTRSIKFVLLFVVSFASATTLPYIKDKNLSKREEKG